MNKEESIDSVDMNKAGEEKILKTMIDSNLITEQGLRIQGVGILIRKLERMIELQDKTNLKLHFIEKKLENK